MSRKQTLLVLTFVMLTAKRLHLALSSLELLFLPFFSLPPSSYLIFQKTAIIKSLFLKKEWLLELSSTEHPHQFVSVYDRDKLSLWLYEPVPGLWSEYLVVYPGFLTSLLWDSIEIVYEKGDKLLKCQRAALL